MKEVDIKELSPRTIELLGLTPESTKKSLGAAEFLPEEIYHPGLEESLALIVDDEVGKKFKKTEKQRELLSLMNTHFCTLAYGGSRSGKTTAIIRNMILRGTKIGSRHLVVRFRFNHAKTSLMGEFGTVDLVFKMCFPGLDFKVNHI